MSRKEVKLCENYIDAYIIKGSLENAGINCWLTDENFSAILPSVHEVMNAGIRVMVNEEDYVEAQGILKIDDPKKLVCPECHSTNIGFGFRKNRLFKFFIIIISLLLVMPFGNIHRDYYCKDCGARLK